MTHQIEAFVAQIPALKHIAARYQNAVVVPLQQGFGLIPITRAFRQEVHPDGEPPRKQYWSDEDLLREFHQITDKLTGVGVSASHVSEVAYIETEYWAGDGVQGAIAWHKGAVIIGPLFSDQISVISLILRELGVRKGNAFDEFAALALGKYRHTEDWLKEIGA